MEFVERFMWFLFLTAVLGVLVAVEGFVHCTLPMVEHTSMEIEFHYPQEPDVNRTIEPEAQMDTLEVRL